MISHIALAALRTASVQPAVAQRAAPDLSHAARGDVCGPGGARGLPGDMRQAYRPLSTKGKVRNVILLIGDDRGVIPRSQSRATMPRTLAVISRASRHWPSLANSGTSATAWPSGVKRIITAFPIRSQKMNERLVSGTGNWTSNVHDDL
jgi:alkaline phosphatase